MAALGETGSRDAPDITQSEYANAHVLAFLRQEHWSWVACEVWRAPPVFGRAPEL